MNGWPLREEVAGAELEPQLHGERRKGERDGENGATTSRPWPPARARAATSDQGRCTSMRGGGLLNAGAVAVSAATAAARSAALKAPVVTQNSTRLSLGSLV